MCVITLQNVFFIKTMREGSSTLWKELKKSIDKNYAVSYPSRPDPENGGGGSGCV